MKRLIFALLICFPLITQAQTLDVKLEIIVNGKEVNLDSVRTCFMYGDSTDLMFRYIVPDGDILKLEKSMLSKYRYIRLIVQLPDERIWGWFEIAPTTLLNSKYMHLGVVDYPQYSVPSEFGLENDQSFVLHYISYSDADGAYIDSMIYKDYELYSKHVIRMRKFFDIF